MEHHRLLQHDIASEGVCMTIVTKLVRLLLDEEMTRGSVDLEWCI